MNKGSLALLSIAACGLTLAACSEGTQLPLLNARTTRAASSPRVITTGANNYRIVFNFGKGNDGQGPNGDLIYRNGLLYGTTYAGGTGEVGTVFVADLHGSERVLYAFNPFTKDDGMYPSAGVTYLNGVLYGTTYWGGFGGSSSRCCGVVYGVTLKGKERVLHNFGEDEDGFNPTAGLIVLNGTLYGTTSYGGKYAAGGSSSSSGGTVFSVGRGGQERVLHNFGKGKDGVNPVAPLLNVNGTFYGTTSAGGDYGDGTVFSLSPNGVERILHSFNYQRDADYPIAGLTYVNGLLYGTTSDGGLYAHGIAFSISLKGVFHILHQFGRAPDGNSPNSRLIDVRGMLYGTTASGPYYVSRKGAGTVFSLTYDGKERVLHVFGNGTDGGRPTGLTNVNGTLYGTTGIGGAFGNSYTGGTIFSLAP